MVSKIFTVENGRGIVKGIKEIGAVKLKQNNQIVVDPCIRLLRLRLKNRRHRCSFSCDLAGRSDATINISCDSWPSIITHFYNILSPNSTAFFCKVCSNLLVSFC